MTTFSSVSKTKEDAPSAGQPARGVSADSLGRILLALAAAAAYVRLFLGVDFTDESFYNATPWWFAGGGRPFHDELSVTQNAALLLTPIFKLYRAIVGSPTGIVLFNRHLYFGLLAVCGLLAFRVGQAYVDRRFARLLAAFALTFSYFNIPSISYNTLGAFLLFDGLCLLLLYAAPEGGRRGATLIFAAGACFVGAAFAHPSLLLAALTALASAFVVAFRGRTGDSATERRSARMAWLAAAAVGAAAAIGFVSAIGLPAIRDSLAYAAAYGISPAESVRPNAWWNWLQLSWMAKNFLVGFIVMLALPILPAQTFPRWRASFPLLVAVVSAAILYLAHRNPMLGLLYPAGSVPLYLCFALVSPVLLFLLRDRAQSLRMALIVMPAAWVAMLTIAFTSTNTMVSATIGAFPAAVCALLVVGMIAAKLDQDPRANGMRRQAAMAVLAAVVVFQGVNLLERTYRDAPFRDGPPRFAPGPFAGILTSEYHANLLASVTADLRQFGANARTLFAYDEFPAGYLLSPLQPRTFSTWIFWPPDPAVAKPFFSRVFTPADPPDVVLRVLPATLVLNGELKQLGYKVRVVRPEFGYMLLTRDPVASGVVAARRS